ncbi:hypothetical protein [Dialister micraerophilus]|uniref:hypothetical protein n=1 Tax=Dialister micraerophilus TaxID=309120 RepID=UPI0023F32365|nr:hypothetical protein [Dialister micraerophilus]MDK8253670.1 hypothetical protein [Dialister micraerophilus]
MIDLFHRILNSNSPHIWILSILIPWIVIKKVKDVLSYKNYGLKYFVIIEGPKILGIAVFIYMYLCFLEYFSYEEMLLNLILFGVVSLLRSLSCFIQIKEYNYIFDTKKLKRKRKEMFVMLLCGIYFISAFYLFYFK